MTGQMPDIINRIYALRYKTWKELGKEPNTIYMSISDYRQLCEAAKDYWLPRTTKPSHCTGVPLEKKSSDARPMQIMLMRIVKRAGEMECAFVPPIVEIE